MYQTRRHLSQHTYELYVYYTGKGDVVKKILRPVGGGGAFESATLL